MRDIKYIGTGAFEDRLFGSNKTWEYPGQVQEVPDPAAARMLRHPVFVEVDTEVVRADLQTRQLSAGKPIREGDASHLGPVVVDFSRGALSRLSSAAGESATVQEIGGSAYAQCVLSSAPSQLFGAEFVLDEPVFLGHGETLQIPLLFDNNRTENLAGDLIQVWLYTAGTGNQVRLQLSTSNLQPGAVNVISFSRDSLLAGAAPITQLDVDRIDKVRLYLTSGSAPAAAAAERTFHLGPIRAGSRRKGRVVWYMDGAYESQQRYILPLMERLGIKASLALVHAQIGQPGCMSEAQILAAGARGHLLCHHTFGAATGGYGNGAQWPTEESIYRDLMSSWDWLAARGTSAGIGHAVVGYVNYWTGSTPKAQAAAIKSALQRAGVKTLRRGGSFMPAAGGVGVLHSLAAPASAWVPMLGGIQVTNTTTVDQVKAVIDAAEQRGELANIVLHRSVIDTATPGALEMSNSSLAQCLAYGAARERAGGLLNQTIDEVFVDCAH